VGEQAGFQDTLWGFGMCYGILSGFLAAQSFFQMSDFGDLWRKAMASPTNTLSIKDKASFAKRLVAVIKGGPNP